MALEGKAARPSGWHRQAERLAAVHTARWAETRAGAANALRRQPSQLQPAAPNDGAELRDKPKANGIERSDELKSEFAKLAKFKRQELPEPASVRIADARRRAFVADVAAAGNRAAALAGEAGSLRDEIARRENENASLHASLDLVVSENSHLCGRLAETEVTLARVQSQLDLASTSLAEAQAERDRLAAVVAAQETHRTETDALNADLEAASSRAVAAETLLAEARQDLIARAEENTLILGENLRLSACVTRSDIAIDAARSQVEAVKTALTAAEAERDALAAELDAANQRHLIEANALAIRVEIMSTRAVAAEKQLAEARQSLAARAEENALIVGESALLFQRLAESDAAVDTAWSQLAEVKAELSAAQAERAKLAGQLKDANEQRQTDVDALNARFEAVAARAGASEKLLTEAQQNLAVQVEENARMLGENSHLSDFVAKSDKAVDQALSQIDQMSTVLVAALAERDKLAAELSDAHDRRRTEIDLLNGRIEEMSEGAVAAEKAFAEAKQSLVDKLEHLESSLQLATARIEDLERARSQLIEGANALLNAVGTREAALTRAEGRNKLLAERVQILLKHVFAQPFASSFQLKLELPKDLFDL
jgi:chromosome segregation ATPase